MRRKLAGILIESVVTYCESFLAFRCELHLPPPSGHQAEPLEPPQLQRTLFCTKDHGILLRAHVPHICHVF